MGLNSVFFFHLILMAHCLVTFHHANKYNIWPVEKKKLAELPNPEMARNETISIHLLNKSWLPVQKNAFIPK